MSRCAEACDELLKECVTRGAHDNLSALVIMCGSKEPFIIQHEEKSCRIEVPEPSKFSEFSLQSPKGGTSQSLESPTSGSRNRTPTDRTLSRVFSTQQSQDEQEQDPLSEEGESVSRHLEFTRELK